MSHLGPAVLLHGVGVGLYSAVQEIPLAESCSPLVCLCCAEFQISVLGTFVDVDLWVGALLHRGEHALHVEEFFGFFSEMFQLS